MPATIRILLLEDSQQDAHLLIGELKQKGVEPLYERVDTREDMETALDNYTWDVIIADYWMPSFNVFEALNVVQKRNLDIPFIVVSGMIDEETVVKAMKAGAHDYIKKGDFARLVPAIERELREAAMRSQHVVAEDALRESEILLRTVIDTTPDLISVKNSEGQFILTNRRMARYHGCTPQDMIGKTDADYLDAHWGRPNEISKFQKDDQYVLQTQRPLEIPDESYTMPDGAVYRFRTIKIPLDLNGNKDYVLTISTDITEHIKSREEKEKIQDQFLQAQKMEAIGTLTGGVAHDFNNLLTAIHGCTDMALARVSHDDPIYHDLREIQASAGRATDLTHQLLLFSRKAPTQFKPLNLNDVINGILKMLHRLIGEDVRVTIDLDPDIRVIRADLGTIEQVIMNLAVNSRDAMPNGGVLTLRTFNHDLSEKEKEQVTGTDSNQFICLQINDTGTGISRQLIPHVFEPFFTTKGYGKGTGLGLSVVYGIVTQHGGWIDVTSNQEEGTTFSLYFPAVNESPEDIHAEVVSLEPFRGNGQRILVVEDETGLRDVVRSALTKYGYEVCAVEDAETAIRVFHDEKGRFDFIFSDVVLPDQSGVQLIDALLEEKCTLKFLLTSGYTDQKSQWRIIQEKGYPFLQKPYKLAEMLEKIKTILDR